MNSPVLTTFNYQQFIGRNDVAVILFETSWDVGGRARIQPQYQRALIELGDCVAFAEVDADADIGLSESIPVMNVPTVVYYRHGRQMAALIGATQDIAARTRRLMAGQLIGYDDGLS